MKRRSIFIAIIVSLFMFQSAWNVAAAFCAHENMTDSTTPSLSNHFGHHALLASCQNEHAADEHSYSKSQFSEKSLNLQDHHDHLPSFSHILVINTRTEIFESPHFILEHQPFFAWSNLYQSPDLGALTPPPLSIPL